MAQSSGRASADDSTGEPDAATGRPASVDALWADVCIDPVEIALPSGVGYTLRAYRPASELTGPDIDQASAADRDDFDAAAKAVLARRRAVPTDEDGEAAELDDTLVDIGKVPRADDPDADDPDARPDSRAATDPDDPDWEPDPADFEDSEEEPEEEEVTEDEEEAVADEDVPVFLGARGRVYLFHTPEKLAEFVRSGAENDLSQLEHWPELTRRITAGDVEPLDDDSYELDLVVENLRGGADAWNPQVIMKAGEIARDVAYAMRLQPVLTALSPGSPLDDLDEALRAAEAGGVGGFLARRKLRKVAGQQAALGWRTIIGKISAVVDWRD